MTFEMVLWFLAGIAAATLAMVLVSYVERRRAGRRFRRIHPDSPMGQLNSRFSDILDALERELTERPSDRPGPSEADDVES